MVMSFGRSACACGAQRLDVDGVAVGVDRRGVDLQAVEAGAARPWCVTWPPMRRGGDDDAVAGLGRPMKT